MGMLIDGRKAFEDEHVIVYAFEWADGHAVGTIAAVKPDLERHVVAPSADLDRVAVKVLAQAKRQSEIDGVWPDVVVHAS